MASLTGPETDEISDAELLDRCVSGDRADIELFGSSLPWLVTTARNLARNHRRATHRRGFVSLNDDIDSHGSAGADSSADARRVAQQLEAMLSGLAPLDQQIIQLCLSTEPATSVRRGSSASATGLCAIAWHERGNTSGTPSARQGKNDESHSGL